MIYRSAKCYVRKAELKDIPDLVSNMRFEDIRELSSTAGREIRLELLIAYSIGASTDAFTLVDGDTERVIAMVGVAPAGDGTGSIWMHGTNLMAKHPITFVRRTPAVLKLLHKNYPILTNWADLRNEVHINWLRWAGFRFTQVSRTFSNDGSPFVEFLRKGD